MQVRTTDGWVEMSEADVRREMAAPYGQEGPRVIEHNNFMNEHYPIPMTKERAQHILEHVGPFGALRYSFYRAYAASERLYADGITQQEDKYIKQVWDTMPGNTAYIHALQRIAKGEI